MKTSSMLFAAIVSIVAGIAVAGHGVDTTPGLHLHDDVNRDFRADILFRGGDALAYWTIDFSGTQPAISSAYAGNGGLGYRVVAVSDFDGDRSADVLWSNGVHLKLWINNGAGSYTPVPVGNYGGGWEPFAAGDINGDGRSDLFFRGSTHLAYWLMDGPRVIGSSYAGDGGAGWQVVAIGNRGVPSGKAEVLWTDGRQLKVWTVKDTSNHGIDYQANGVEFYAWDLEERYGGGWTPFAIGDIDGNGYTDILFRAGTHVAYWLLKPTAMDFVYESYYAGNGGAGFSAIGVSDYHGDGLADVLWSNGSQIKLWRGTCPTYDWDYGCGVPEFVPQLIGTYGGGWQPLEMLIAQE